LESRGGGDTQNLFVTLLGGRRGANSVGVLGTSRWHDRNMLNRPVSPRPGRSALVRLTAFALATLTLVLGPSSVATARADEPNEKTTVTDIQHRISYSQEIPGNCAVFGFSQWQAATFRGWDAVRVSITLGTSPPRTDTFPVSPPPKYDDELKYGGNTVSPPNGSHWVLIGNGSYRAGPPPADPDCQELLARSRAAVPDNKVTTTFRRTSDCAAKFAKLTAAQKAVKKAKGKSRKARSRAKKSLSKAEKAFNKDCSK
jgi:hypothetical protein